MEITFVGATMAWSLGYGRIDSGVLHVRSEYVLRCANRNIHPETYSSLEALKVK